jgi:hypothetical protein
MLIISYIRKVYIPPIKQALYHRKEQVISISPPPPHNSSPSDGNDTKIFHGDISLPTWITSS